MLSINSMMNEKPLDCIQNSSQVHGQKGSDATTSVYDITLLLLCRCDWQLRDEVVLLEAAHFIGPYEHRITDTINFGQLLFLHCHLLAVLSLLVSSRRR